MKMDNQTAESGDLFADLGEGVIGCDQHAEIIFANQLAAKLLNQRFDSLVGKCWLNLLDPRSQAIAGRLLSATFRPQDNLIEYYDLRLLAVDGHRPVISVAANLSQRLGVALVSFRDVTRERELVRTLSQTGDLLETLVEDPQDRDNMERRLQDALQKAKLSDRQAVAIELAGAAAHQLNQPLTSIMGYASILERRVSDDERMQKAVSVINRETVRMAEIVKRLGRITEYETERYVGNTTILGLPEHGEG